MATRKAQPTTVTSPAPAIIRCSCSISLAIWNAAHCVQAPSIRPTVGRTCRSRSWLGLGACSSALLVVLRARFDGTTPISAIRRKVGRHRRVVAKVEWHPGELYPRVGFIVTNLARPAERVVAFYNKRGTCEQWIKEGKRAIKWTRLSCCSFAANAVRLQLHALTYNCLLYTSPSPRDRTRSRMPSSA